MFLKDIPNQPLNADVLGVILTFSTRKSMAESGTYDSVLCYRFQLYLHPDNVDTVENEYWGVGSKHPGKR